MSNPENRNDKRPFELLRTFIFCLILKNVKRIGTCETLYNHPKKERDSGPQATGLQQMPTISKEKLT